jgi:propionate catabolism operon transcriptional regulator
LPTSLDAPAELALPQASQQVDVAEVLARFGGQREAAARHLGISRTTLWRRLKGSTQER